METLFILLLLQALFIHLILQMQKQLVELLLHTRQAELLILFTHLLHLEHLRQHKI